MPVSVPLRFLCLLLLAMMAFGCDAITGSGKSSSEDDASDSSKSKKKKKSKSKKKKKKGKKKDDDGDSKAAKPSPEPAPEASPAPVPTTEKPTGDEQTDKWIGVMRELLPKELCKTGSFFRECFTIDEAECLQVAKAELEPCVTKNAASLPQIRDSETGRKGGEMLGRCVGIAFQQGLDKKGKFTNTQKCNDPSQW